MKKKNVILADCEESEIKDLIDGINKSFNKNQFICRSYIANGQRTGIFSQIKRYWKYFFVPLNVILNRKKYSIIIGWQQFYALIFCFWCSLFRIKKVNKVVAMNFTYKEKKGPIGKIYKYFMKKCLDIKYLDYLHVLSKEYAQIINKQFKYPIENIIVSHFGVEDIYEKWKDIERPIEEKYFLAIGRSNRDYDFLIDSWNNIDAKLIIISDSYKNNKAEKNIEIINNISGDTQYPWIMNAEGIILILKEPNIASGDTVLLRAMSFKKIVIVNNQSTLAEMYIENKKNGIIINKNEDELKNAIKKINNNEYEEIKENARNSYINKFSRLSMGIKIGNLISKN